MLPAAPRVCTPRRPASPAVTQATVAGHGLDLVVNGSEATLSVGGVEVTADVADVSPRLAVLALRAPVTGAEGSAVVLETLRVYDVATSDVAVLTPAVGVGKLVAGAMLKCHARHAVAVHRTLTLTAVLPDATLPLPNAVSRPVAAFMRPHVHRRLCRRSVARWPVLARARVYVHVRCRCHVLPGRRHSADQGDLQLAE